MQMAKTAKFTKAQMPSQWQPSQAAADAPTAAAAPTGAAPSSHQLPSGHQHHSVF